MPDRKKNGKDFRPLEHATTNFHASVTDMRKHDFPPKFADVMQQFGLNAFMVCYDYHKHGAHQILHKLCKKNSWAYAFDQLEKAWIVLAPSLDVLCKEMRAEAKRSAPKIKAETDIEVKRLSKSMRVKKGTLSALTRRLRELEASSSEEESKSTESRSSNESDSDRGSDSDDSDSSVVDVPLAKAVPVVVEPKKKRKSTVVDSSDDDAPPAKRSKTKLKGKSSAWKFIADEAEASDMESDSEELRANDADHAFLDDNRHDDDEVQEIPRMPGKPRKRRLYQKTKASKSRKQVGGEPWTQETNSRHISKTEEFPTKDSVIRDLFKEAPKMSNAKAEKKAEKKARKRKRSKHEGDTQRQVSEAPKGKLKKKVFMKKINEKTANVGHRVSAKADDKSTQKQSKKANEEFTPLSMTRPRRGSKST